MTKHKHSGFTLLEVLISGFILFMVVASTTLVYQGALLSSGKAEQSLIFATAVSPIRRIVSEYIHAKVSLKETNQVAIEGEGVYGALRYQWVATVSHIGIPQEIFRESGYLGADFRYLLWDIELKLQGSNMQRNYKFSEVTW
tara:strand:+ start:59 stop:484 length:426 start_codon:yes stop_codon:yes gene_type:complete